MTSRYVFFILFASVFCQRNDSELTNTTSTFDGAATTIGENKTDRTSPSTTSVLISTTTEIISTTLDETTLTIPTTISLETSATNEVNTSTNENNIPSKPSSKSHRWLLVVLILIIAIALSIGIIHYYRRQTPYTRFLQNWRSQDDDTDNLQLEQPEINNDRYSPRISFS